MTTEKSPPLTAENSPTLGKLDRIGFEQPLDPTKRPKIALKAAKPAGQKNTSRIQV